jgi:hypothetical protein
MTFPEDPIPTYKQGQRITLYVDFTNAAGAAANPDAALLKYIEGDGTEVEVLQAALTNPSLGRWEYGLALPKDGDKAVKPWTYRFEGTSAATSGVNAADEKRFEVEASPFYPPSS